MRQPSEAPRGARPLARYFFLFFFLIAFSATGAETKAATSWRERVSFDEFQSILKDSVARVPDLKLLWTLPIPRENVYFGGGALRGLVRWLDEKLSGHTPEEVRAMDVPTVNELLIVKEADRDLWAPDSLVFALRQQGYNGWDVLSETFYQGSLKAGGPAMEKLRVNPWAISDPFGALSAYYKGEHQFILTSDAEFRECAAFGWRHNSRTTLALRFLRFLFDLPGAKATPESFEAIRKLAALEASTVGPGNFFIRKAIGKLYSAARNDRFGLLSNLSRAGLIRFLLSKGYVLVEGTYTLPYFLLDLDTAARERRPFYLHDIAGLEMLFAPTGDAKVRLRKGLIPFATSAAELIELLEPLSLLGRDRRLGSEIQRVALDATERLVELGATKEEIARFANTLLFDASARRAFEAKLPEALRPPEPTAIERCQGVLRRIGVRPISKREASRLPTPAVNGRPQAFRIPRKRLVRAA